MNKILINLLHILHLSKLATNSKRSKSNNQAIPKIIGRYPKSGYKSILLPITEESQLDSFWVWIITLKSLIKTHQRYQNTVKPITNQVINVPKKKKNRNPSTIRNPNWVKWQIMKTNLRIKTPCSRRLQQQNQRLLWRCVVVGGGSSKKKQRIFFNLV